MKRFVYTPKLEVFVKLDDDERGHQTINLTDDIVSGSVTRRLNAVSEASLTLQNKHGKYTGGLQGEELVSGVGIIIKPMDRIIVKLSRVGVPFLVFSGYVDEAPYYQLYPGPVTIRCSCPLKLLQYTFFDPGLPYMNQFFANFGWYYDPTSGLLQDNVGSGGVDGTFGNFDVSAGIGKVLEETLIHIGGWNPNAIDILSIPTEFLQNINKAMNQELKDQQIIEEQMLKRLETLYGIAAATPTTPAPGGSGTQVFGNIPAARVAKLALDAGFKGNAAIIAVAIALAESSLNSSAVNYNSNSTYDLGLWQINTVHTPGGTGLPGPSTGVGTTTLSDFQAVVLPPGVKTFAENMFVPAKNAAEAYSVSGSGSDFTHWSTFTTADSSRSYKGHMAEATAAVGSAKLGIGGTDFTATNTTANDVTRQDNPNTNSIATNIIKIALAESKKGIHESNGSNTGVEIQKYFTYVGIAEGNPWCACFVSWVYGSAGKKNIKEAYVGNFVSHGSYTTTPQPADIVIWGDQHAGIVINIQGALTEPGSVAPTISVATHGDQSPKRIVLHDAEGDSDPRGIGSAWTSNHFGAHIAVGADGTIARLAPDNKITFHTGGANTDSLGLEMMGFASYSTSKWRTERSAQFEAVAKQLAWWCSKYNIPVVKDPESGISTHAMQSAIHPESGGHTDPGPNYPFDALLVRVKQLMTPVGAGSQTSFVTVEGNSSDGVNQRTYTLGQADSNGNIPKFIRIPGIGVADTTVVGGTGGTTTGATPGDGQSLDPKSIAMQAAWFTLQLQSDDAILSQSLTGTRAIANDIPLLNWISSMVQGSARVFTTKPDGTFFAFFPDRFGYFHDTPYFQVSDIELIDLTVQRNDQNLATHVFATGSIYGAQAGITWMDKLSSTVASIESPAFPYFINVNPNDPRIKSSQGFSHFQFLRKYGARPFSFELPDVRHPILLWMACWMKFVELWAKQYTANASMTFMPEILPGGLVEFGGRITMFVEEVTHNFDRESGFTTDAQLTSPASIDPNRFSGLPIKGGRFTENDYIDGNQFFKDLANG